MDVVWKFLYNALPVGIGGVGGWYLFEPTCFTVEGLAPPEGSLCQTNPSSPFCTGTFGDCTINGLGWDMGGLVGSIDPYFAGVVVGIVTIVVATLVSNKTGWNLALFGAMPRDTEPDGPAGTKTDK